MSRPGNRLAGDPFARRPDPSQNAQEVAKKRGLPLETVQEQFIQVHLTPLNLLEGLSEEYLLPASQSGPVIANEGYKHYAEHTEDVKRWLEESP